MFGATFKLSIGIGLIALRIVIYASNYPLLSATNIVILNFVCLALGTLLIPSALYSIRLTGMPDENKTRTLTRRIVKIAFAVIVLAAVWVPTALEIESSEVENEKRQAAERNHREIEKKFAEDQRTIEEERKADEKWRARDRVRVMLERSLQSAGLRLTGLRRQDDTPPYLRGKIVVLLKDSEGLHIPQYFDERSDGDGKGLHIPEFFNRLPDEIRATRSDEIGTIVLLTSSREKGRVYVRKDDPNTLIPGSRNVTWYYIILSMTLIDNSAGTIIHEETFRSSAPPDEIKLQTASTEVYGENPIGRVRSYIESLHRIQ